MTERVIMPFSFLDNNPCSFITSQVFMEFVVEHVVFSFFISKLHFIKFLTQFIINLHKLLIFISLLKLLLPLLTRSRRRLQQLRFLLFYLNLVFLQIHLLQVHCLLKLFPLAIVPFLECLDFKMDFLWFLDSHWRSLTFLRSFRNTLPWTKHSSQIIWAILIILFEPLLILFPLIHMSKKLSCRLFNILISLTPLHFLKRLRFRFFYLFF